MKYVFAFSLLFVFHVVSADVGMVVFTNLPATLTVGVTSTVITIETEDASGQSENITETSDVVLKTTSKTGKFFGVGGGKLSGTMSKNTAHKNFLYIDTTEGTYELTAEVTGRQSLKTLSAKREVVVTKNTTPPPVSAKKSVTPVTIVKSEPKPTEKVAVKSVSSSLSTTSLSAESESGTVIFVAKGNDSFIHKFVHFFYRLFFEE